MAVAADFIEIIAIAATVGATAALVYLLWLILEERAVKRYLRERSKLAHSILEVRPDEVRPVEVRPDEVRPVEVRPVRAPAPDSYLRDRRLAHSFRH